MKITGVETVQVAEYSNLLWLRLHTDEGLVGLGETFRNPGSVSAYVHETLAPNLIGKDPRHREALSFRLARRIGNHFNGFPTRSVEVCGNSAVDFALWDLCGQAAGVPVHDLLGGLTRDRAPIYNTCAGTSYNNQLRTAYNTELLCRDDPPPARISRTEDLLRQVYEPGDLALDLLEQGITGMKIWPFDPFALRSGGEAISAGDLRKALWPIEQIRSTAGDRMEILLEYHGLWHLPAALRIAEALADLDIYWHEEPIWMQNFDDLARYRARVSGRVCGSENLGTPAWYREVFGRGALDVANFDMAWVGGLTAGQRIAHLADVYDRVIAPHDCTGPVTLVANVHLIMAAPNATLAETVRSHLNGFYREVVTDLPSATGGHIHPMTGPGLGTRLRPDLLRRKDCSVRQSGACRQEGAA